MKKAFNYLAAAIVVGGVGVILGGLALATAIGAVEW